MKAASGAVRRPIYVFFVCFLLLQEFQQKFVLLYFKTLKNRSDNSSKQIFL